MDIIKERRSIRKYKDIKVEYDKLLEILEAGRLAPSAKNRQNWYFIVLNKKQKDTIGDLLINLKQEEKEEGDYTYSTSAPFTGKIIKEAPLMILIYTKDDNNYLISDTLSLGASIENMILKATELKLGSLWVRDTTHIENKINDLLNITDMKLSSGLLLGYPNQSPNPRPRKDLKDITTFYN